MNIIPTITIIFKITFMFSHINLKIIFHNYIKQVGHHISRWSVQRSHYLWQHRTAFQPSIHHTTDYAKVRLQEEPIVGSPTASSTVDLSFAYLAGWIFQITLFFLCCRSLVKTMLEMRLSAILCYARKQQNIKINKIFWFYSLNKNLMKIDNFLLLK